ncbi:MAG: acyltransferase [bacterium]|nr:acyltransferase [bacterium]
MIRRLLPKARHWRNVRLLDRCGSSSTVSGGVDKRARESIIEVGDRCLIEGILVTEAPQSRIRIGNNVFVGGATQIVAVESIVVEDDVLISYSCLLNDSDGHSLQLSRRRSDLQEYLRGERHWDRARARPIRICQGAWIGARVIITKGVTIGEGAICGTGSVVTRDVAPFTIVAGNPARLVRELSPDER